MGFFQDLKQDLSQTVNDLEAEDTAVELDLDDEETTASEDLFGSAANTDFADLEAMLEKEVAALGETPAGTAEPAAEEISEDADAAAVLNDMEYGETTQADEQVSVGDEQSTSTEPTVEEILAEVPDMGISANEDVETAAENKTSDADAEMEQLLSEVEQNIQEPAYMEAAPETAPQDDLEENVATSTDTAVITEGMNITGDVTSSGNMDLIGSITGNIEILGKLNVTGSITGNSSASEIYAESAQINGEVKSKGSVKIGQSSVVIGNIFATSAVIAGAVKGDIDVHGPVILDTSAIVMGNIKSKSVQINNGAVIEGMCSQCYADVSPTAFFNDVKKNRK